MLFNSQAFIVGFLPVVLAAYYLVARHRTARLLAIIAGSLFFYGWWDVRFLPLLVGLTLANWLLAQAYVRTGRRVFLAAGIAGNLGALAFFKYANFFAANVAALLGRHFAALDIVLPLGISFFVFQKLSYLIDLWRGDRHAYGLVEFSAFVGFFPQLIAGPIVRHNEIIPQFDLPPHRSEMWENLGRGFALFVIGLAKKVAFADFAGRVCDPLFARAATGSPLGLGEAWTAAVTYALQIYFDFSGYSDMAIGLALMFGLRLPMNFDAPYRSTSIRDFWRRWHMTLSRFLRDYLYIPLGGNRVGPVRQALNVVLTMLLGGLWHGAGWTFVVWGGLHGAALAVNGAWNRAGRRLPVPVGWAVTLLFVVAAWVVFRAPDFRTAADVWASMLGLQGLRFSHIHDLAFIILALLAAFFGPTSQQIALERLRPSPFLAVAAAVGLVLGLLQIGGAIPNAFIYFQF